MRTDTSFRMVAHVVVVVALTSSGLAGRGGTDTGEVSVTVHEPESRTPLPCRVWVTVGGQRVFNPVGESCIPYAKDRSFSCDGRFTINVPAGEAVIHVERGKEYLPVEKQIIVSQGQKIEVDIALKRWVNMAEEGWYSGDLHCHFGVGDLAVLKQLALADDVNFEPVSTLWNHQRSSLSDKVWPDWPTGPSVYADKTHLVTLRNEEIERIGGGPFESIGALLMFGLSRPVEMPLRNGRHPCDAVLGQFAKSNSPECVIDTDKPIWGQNVVGVALGLFDCVQVCHNHYHREATIPVGWGMAAPDIEDRNEDWDADELFWRTNLTYYRFLNCGFKLAATGGSAMGVMPVPLGYNRTYAKLNGPLTEANYLAAIRAGRTFATSGPILILTANGFDCGSEIQCSADTGKPIVVKARLRSSQPIDSLEVIHNGNVIEKVDLRSLRVTRAWEKSITLKLNPERSGWVAARAIFTAPDGHLRQAHTSPVYITVDAKPTASMRDAECMIRWIDRLVRVANKPGRYESDEHRDETLAMFKKAKQVYVKIARTATEHWQEDP
ncbi:MAG: CehA/McbA family metallohydrolase [Phycisphaerales bacterium]|nr:MAG: CehA/McbA family metallohydrolase [Phycisphaerales bacterium]